MHRQNIEAWQHGHAFGQDRVRADERISDLHVWSIGPGIHAAIVALVADDPKTPEHYRARLQETLPSLIHVTLEIQRCPRHGSRIGGRLDNPLVHQACCARAAPEDSVLSVRLTSDAFKA
ncbi:MAG: hypothetical protein RJQ08_02570 [Salinisphaeraceae bacterium]|uniref:Uncharacterized protein n=2 Tax=Spectribacter TaxID=3160928 RepID=A0ABU3C332_9GAMM|nr:MULTISPECIES: hypothetical protein [unclassified Salinisphaera]MDT0618379.1 hypothetical protein [Salinisphaera sp. P385]MDT0635749.1 hypothetical protein [Salinisphaera sp. W335]